MPPDVRMAARYASKSAQQQAISANPLTIDLGSCVFCPLCVEACPEGAITYTNDYRMAATSRHGLRLGEVQDVTPEA